MTATAQYAIPGMIILTVLFFRLRSVGKARRLRLERLWILPTLYAAVVGFVFWNAPPHGMTWLWCVVALGVGAGLGWWRGRLMRVAVDPETHELSQTVSPAALLFIVALIVIRSASRAMAIEMAGPGHAGLMAATDILMAFALGFVAFQRVEIFIRARRMLAEARAKRP
ncbi:CcdC protein domain-containing protein [Sphingopyxis sp.]|uniref:CcdC protein domain-containing protein n=1 Tax=Sphingopyxis sp. TaxID=1908224 RepID=UPI003D09E8DA